MFEVLLGTICIAALALVGTFIIIALKGSGII